MKYYNMKEKKNKEIESIIFNINVQVLQIKQRKTHNYNEKLF